jgi:hypothetical protein
MKRALELANEFCKEGLIKEYAIGGGIATIYYVEPFFTYDLDLFIILLKKPEGSLILLSPIFEYLEKKGCYWRKEHIMIEETPVRLFWQIN